jgi:2-methylcitrate dehydratase PrpD
MDLAVEFAEHACRTTYADLPAATVEATKAFILDTVGAAIAGSSAAGVDVPTDRSSPARSRPAGAGRLATGLGIPKSSLTHLR